MNHSGGPEKVDFVRLCTFICCMEWCIGLKVIEL